MTSGHALNLLENGRIDIGRKCAEQLVKAFGVHPAVIMFPEYESDLIGGVQLNKNAL